MCFCAISFCLTFCVRGLLFPGCRAVAPPASCLLPSGCVWSWGLCRLPDGRDLCLSTGGWSCVLSLWWVKLCQGLFLEVAVPLQCSCLENPMDGGAWWAPVHGVAKSRAWLSDFTFTFHFHALEKEMATHSSILAWRIPGTEEPSGLPSVGSHRVGHDWSDLAAAAAAAVSSLSLYAACLLMSSPVLLSCLLFAPRHSSTGVYMLLGRTRSWCENGKLWECSCRSTLSRASAISILVSTVSHGWPSPP